jgi:hypothetical protein
VTVQAPRAVPAPPVEARVALDGLESTAAAQRLAGRLVAEGLAAVATDREVWVHRAEVDDAVVLARLFREIDEGRSRVAPPPTSLWHGPLWRQLLAVLVLALIIVPTVVVALAAFDG